MFQGPRASNYASRMRIVDRIMHDLFAFHGEEIMAIGLYGSMAKGADGPYSDIELFGVLHTPGVHDSLEWVYGDGKAEVNIYGADVVQREALEVDEDWPLSQGMFLHAQPLFGDPAYFEQLKALALSPPKAEFDAAIAGIIGAEFYEGIGKLRNARQSGHTAYLPSLACHFARQGALMLGLAQRRCYTTGATMLEESLASPHRPTGYDALCQMIIQGDLADSARVDTALEHFWAGVGSWVAMQNIDLGKWQQWPFEH